MLQVLEATTRAAEAAYKEAYEKSCLDSEGSSDDELTVCSPDASEVVEQLIAVSALQTAATVQPQCIPVTMSTVSALQTVATAHIQ